MDPLPGHPTMVMYPPKTRGSPATRGSQDPSQEPQRPIRWCFCFRLSGGGRSINIDDDDDDADEESFVDSSDDEDLDDDDGGDDALPGVPRNLGASAVGDGAASSSAPGDAGPSSAVDDGGLSFLSLIGARRWVLRLDKRAAE